MSNWLRKPYPFYFSLMRNSFIALCAGMFVSLFLIVFRPFEMEMENCTLDYFPASIAYGAITVGCVFLNIVLLPMIFKRFFNEDSWTVGRELLNISSILISIAIGNYLFAQATSISDSGIMSGLEGLLLSLQYTFSIGVMPVTIFLLLNYNYQLRQNLELADKYDTANTNEEKLQIDDQSAIRIDSDTVNESLEFKPVDILFIAASGNYTEFYFHNGEACRKEILRKPLQKVEQELKGFPFIFRTHRAFLVNLHAVRSYEGNAQGIRLFFDSYNDSIPVSRRRLAEFDHMMNGQDSLSSEKVMQQKPVG